MYRTQQASTLVERAIALLLVFSLPSGALAGSVDDGDWPDPVDYPPTRLMAPPRPAPEKAPARKSGRKFGIFPRKKQKDDSKTTTVGGPPREDTKPQEVPASPFPLLRLPMSIETGGGVLPAGIYLATPTEEEGENAAKAKNPKQRHLTLYQRNEPCMKLELTQFEGTNDNVLIHGTPSPLQKTGAKAGMPNRHIETRLKPDRKSLIFVWEEDALRFDSPPFPVVIDSRPILKF